MPGAKRSHIDGLRERERLAVDLLARGKTIREVARSLEVSERTIWNYRRRPEVQRAIFNLQQELMSQSSGQSLSVVPEAIEVLTAIMNNPEARDADRIAASRTLISGAQGFSERKILERQLADLERQLLATMAVESAPTASPEDDPDPLMPSANPDDFESDDQ